MKWKVVKQVTYYAIVTYGVVGLSDMIIEVRKGGIEQPIANFAFYIGLIILGAFGIKFVKENYKGSFTANDWAIFIFITTIWLTIKWVSEKNVRRLMGLISSAFIATFVIMSRLLGNPGRKKPVHSVDSKHLDAKHE